MSNEQKGQLKLDALKFICESNRSIHEGRINRELKLVATLLPFFILSAGFVISKILTVNIGQFFVLSFLLIFGYLIFFVASYIYLHGSAEANERNHELAKIAEDEILVILDNEPINNVIKKFHDDNIDEKEKTLLQQKPLPWWISKLFEKNKEKYFQWLKNKQVEKIINSIIEIYDSKEFDSEKTNNKFQPNEYRWFWYVKLIGLTSLFCSIAVLISGLIVLILTITCT